MSEVRTDIPADDTQASKTEMRENFQQIKNELEVLEVATSYATRIAYGLVTMSTI